jgi:DNA-binding SARP family transcriptional activator
MAISLRIHLFGLPRVLVDGERTPDFPAEKVRLLFFYLVLFRQTAHARSVLAGTFWGDSPEARAHHSLSTALWRLRNWVEPLQLDANPLLVIEDQHVTFNTGGAYWLDAAEFEEHVSRARKMNPADPKQAAVSLTRATELYGGDLLEGCYADWCLTERERLHQLFLQALVHLMIYHAGLGDYARAISYGQRILQDDPTHEEVQRELMRLFVLDQKPAEALFQYHRCEAALREELGIEPMPETQALFRQLVLRADPTPARPTRPLPGGKHEPDFQAYSILKQVDAAVEQLEAMRNELAHMFAMLQQIRNEASRLEDKRR